MLELKNISADYGNKNILKDISLSFPDGKITAVIGQNGCGKSTLLKICAGHLKPSCGHVLADETDLSALNPQQIARKIAYMPQSRNLPEMTVGTLVLHGRFPWLGYPRIYRKEDIEIAETAMRQAGIWNKREQMLARISGGERQKAYFAMALAQLPENSGHILLDEPTAHLDIAVQIEFSALLSNLKNLRKCVIVILHDINAALELADNIVVINDKRGELLTDLETIEKAFNVKITKREQISFSLK